MCFKREKFSLELESGNGIMLTSLRAREPSFRNRSGRIRGDTEFIFNESPEGSLGEIALLLKANGGESLLHCLLGSQHRTDNNRDWTVRLWAKARPGPAAELVLTPNYGEAQRIPLTDEWRPVETTISVTGAPLWTDGIHYVNLEFSAAGGDVLIDDVYVARGGEDHPSGFRRTALEAYRDMGVGILRVLQGDDTTVARIWFPPAAANSSS